MSPFQMPYCQYRMYMSQPYHRSGMFDQLAPKVQGYANNIEARIKAGELITKILKEKVGPTTHLPYQLLVRTLVDTCCGFKITTEEGTECMVLGILSDIPSERRRLVTKALLLELYAHNAVNQVATIDEEVEAIDALLGDLPWDKLNLYEVQNKRQLWLDQMQVTAVLVTLNQKYELNWPQTTHDRTLEDIMRNLSEFKRYINQHTTFEQVVKNYLINRAIYSGRQEYQGLLPKPTVGKEQIKATIRNMEAELVKLKQSIGEL